MKFGDIKIGDTVLVPVSAKKSSWPHDVKVFMLKADVENVTKTQFTAKGMRFNKNNGSMFGGSMFKCAERYEGTDQAEAYKKEKDRIRLVLLLRNLSEKALISGLESLTHDEIKSAMMAIDQLPEKIIGKRI